MRTARVDPDQARELARQILSDRRFHNAPAPRPLRGPLQWLGDRLRSIVHGLTSALRAVPGPTWVVVALMVVAIVALVVALLVRSQRTVGLFRGTTGSTAKAAREDAGALERAADDAERAGDFDRALRLRFRAGLLRLDQRGAIRYRPSLTTGEVRRALGSATFDELARRFEEVAYGGDAADPDDVHHAREQWPRVLDEPAHR